MLIYSWNISDFFPIFSDVQSQRKNEVTIDCFGVRWRSEQLCFKGQTDRKAMFFVISVWKACFIGVAVAVLLCVFIHPAHTCTYKDLSLKLTVALLPCSDLSFFSGSLFKVLFLTKIHWCVLTLAYVSFYTHISSPHIPFSCLLSVFSWRNVWKGTHLLNT